MQQHCDADVLALIALGEHAGDAGDERHLAECARCQAELDQLRAVVATGRTVTPADQPVPPPAQVWERVARELDIPAGPRQVQGPRLAGDTRRRFAAVLAAAALLLGIVLGVVATLLVTDNDSSRQVVASARLEPLPDKNGAGVARVVGSGPNRELDVDVSGLGPVNGYYEVWLLDADGKKLVSLGLLRGSHGRFVLPPGVDLTTYPVVDISIEPADGNPAHSGDSVVRGRLQV